MATDFFERQEKARTTTSWLVFLFFVALIGIVGVTAGFATLAVYGFRGSDYGRDQQTQSFPWMIPVLAGAGALAVVGLGSLYKILSLRHGGGSSVAEHLGGTRLSPDAAGLHQRRLLNVVEEMAIASGTPVPPVYLLDESGINAFAAGYSPGDAVLGVTRGATEKLSRQQLQGVIAHEFSHILNGDMRLNIRLIGILHGILVVGLIGYFLLRSTFFGASTHSRRRSSGNGKGGGGGGGGAVIVILVVSIGLIIIGFLGNLIGGLIKAAVSRQREYLADASAVQFTRNPGGLAGALKRIGAVARGSRLQHPSAPEASHMFFAQGVAEGFTRAMATHPPLTQRILAIEPTWDGVFPEIEPGETARQETGGAASQVSALAQRELEPEPESDAVPSTSRDAVDRVRQSIGNPTEQHRRYAAQLLSEIDPAVLSAAREPYAARAIVYALMLDTDAEIRDRQFAILDESAEPAIAELTRKLAPVVDLVKPAARLPLVDLSLPALRSLSTPQYQRFDSCFHKLVEADERMDLFEWTMAQILMRHLQSQFGSVHSPRVRYYGLQQLSQPCSVLLSTLAYAGHGESTAETAFAKAAAMLPETRVTRLPTETCHLGSLNAALQQLREVAPRKRAQLVDACAAAICADSRVTIQEAELLRGIADLLECPIPPLLAGQSVAADSQAVGGQ